MDEAKITTVTVINYANAKNYTRMIGIMVRKKTFTNITVDITQQSSHNRKTNP